MSHSMRFMLLCIILSAFLFSATRACSYGCEEEFGFYRYAKLDGVVDEATVELDGETVEFSKHEVEASSGLYVKMSFDKDKDSPNARIGWTDDNNTYCVWYMKDNFHNPREEFQCSDWRESMELNYGTTCEEFDLLGICKKGQRDFFLVVNDGERVAVALFSIVVLALSMLL